MKKIKTRVTAWLLCLVTVITSIPFTSITAFAWTSKSGVKCDSSYGSEFVGYDGKNYYSPDSYQYLKYDKKGDTTVQTRYSGTAKKKYVLTLPSGEKQQVYCIESGVEYSDSKDEYESDSNKNSKFFNNLPTEAQNGIMLAALHGWQKGKKMPISGINKDDYSLATQIIIWEYQQQLRTSPTELHSYSGIRKDNYYRIIKDRPAEKAYDWILKEMKNHLATPSFTGKRKGSAPNHTLKYNPDNKRFILTLTDTNKTGMNLRLVNAPNYVTLERSGNKFTITSEKMITEPILLESAKDIELVGDDLLIWGRPGYQTMMTGVSDPVRFYMNIQTETYGQCQIMKQSEDGIVADIPFTIKGNGIEQSVKTDSSGKILVKELLPGTYTITEDKIDRYVQPKAQTVTVKSGETASVTFSNVLKKWRADVIKSDSQTGTAQGDGKLSGAEYGVYYKGTLVDTYTTNESGKFITKSYPCGNEWTIKEISPSKGYLLNLEVYKVPANADAFTSENNTISVNVKEDEIFGNVMIIKHTDENNETVDISETDRDSGMIEKPEAGAEFEIFLSTAKSYDKAKEKERDIMVTDENGFASSKYMPFGVYVVHQIKGKEGKAFVPDFKVFIAEHEKSYSYIINNTSIKSKIKIEKRDAETGNLIPASGIGFQVYDSKGSLITMHFDYPTPTDIDTFYTNNEGWLMLPETLAYGKYKLKEIQTADGYFLGDEVIDFTVDGSEKVLTVEKYNTAQKGVIKIEKTGEQFSSVSVIGGAKQEDGNETALPTIYQPVYEVSGLAGAVFEIYAAEDIYTLDGTLRAAAGTLVDTITTNENGNAQTKELYLGKYEIRETTAPHEMVLPKKPYYAELVYAGQEIKVTETLLSIYNERQKAEISLDKYMEQDERFNLGMNAEIESVTFGLYAKEELTAADGSVIPAGGLLEVITPDNNGHGVFSSNLPFGEYYVQEISTNSNYQLSADKYPVKFEYEGSKIGIVKIKVNNGTPIDNKLKRGKIEGIKVDETNKPLSGALIGLFAEDESEFSENKAIITCISDENGAFSFENIPYGAYKVKEIKQPPGYVLNENAFPVVISDKSLTVSISIENKRIIGKLQLNKVDKEFPDSKLTGAVFEVYRDTNSNKKLDKKDKLLGTMTEKDGVYEMKDLAYGSYFVKEKKAPKGYLLDDKSYYASVENDGETVMIENEAGVGFINTHKTGELIIQKNSADGKLQGFSFLIEGKDEYGNSYKKTFTTDEKGKIRITGLRTGTYKVSEVSDKVSKKYILPFAQIVSIEYHKKAQLNFYNALPDTPETGDNHNTFLWYLIAALSAGAVLLTLFKKKSGKRK